ncbi:hypothetical protein D3C84_856430 [compost metagenome]
MLETAQQRLLGQTGRTREQLHTLLPVAFWIGRKSAALQDAPRQGDGRRRIAAQTLATGDDELGHALAKTRRECQQLGTHQWQVERNTQAPAAFGQPRQMVFEQRGSTGTHGNGLEKPIAVGQAAILDGQRLGRVAVDPAMHQPANRRNTREPLVPPKPKELDSTMSMDMERAS